MGEVMRRIHLSFAPHVEVEFTDREFALRKMEEWAEKGMVNVQLVYGPEGCGKTAWLKQSVELLRDLGFEVIYVNPIEKEVMMETGVADVKVRFVEMLREATESTWVRIAWAVVDMAREIMKAGAKKVAILADDVFQAIGLDKAAIYVKGLLGLIEYPPRTYDVVIAVAATSEGVSRREIGRHRWADMRPMWNMPREGFRQLYEQLPGSKPGFDTIWRLTGGNPAMLSSLYRAGWDAKKVISDLIMSKNLKAFIGSLGDKEKQLLTKAIEDPDTLMTREGIPLMNRLVELNLVTEIPEWRDPWYWTGEPPGKDLELGIGRDLAWQTPMHREAVKRVLVGTI